MKILIADDDRLVRYSLKSMIEDILGKTELFEAKNGKELVELYEYLSPDLCFVDISMPLMDGLTAIEECRKIRQDCQFVVLTAYADFEYAKRSIVLGVKDYLLKPVSPAELDKLFDTLERDFSARNDLRQARFQQKVLEHFQSDFDIKTDKPLYDREMASKYMLFTVFFNYPPKSDGEKALRQEFLDCIRSKGAYWAREKLIIAPVLSGEHIIHIFAGSGSSSGLGALRDEITRLCRSCSSGGGVVSAIYMEGNRLSHIYTEASNIEGRPYINWTAEPRSVMPFDKVTDLLTDENLCFLELFNELMDDFSKADQVKFKHTLIELMQKHPDSPKGLNPRSMASLVGAASGMEISGESWHSLYTGLRKLPGRMSSFVGIPRGSKIAKIQEYVAENYMKDISVAIVAEQFDLSPNYLSALFKEKTGSRFIDYLTQVRITNAQRILGGDEHVSVKELAQLVGYTSPRHFTNLFKSHVGCYPSEYKRLNKSCHNAGNEY